MKKTFQLNIAGKNPARVLDATKHEIRQYIKRERRKALPEGVDYWDFDCRFGSLPTDAAKVHLNDITGLIDQAAMRGETSFYLEIIAKPGVRLAGSPRKPTLSES